jgi:hypothetical protein
LVLQYSSLSALPFIWSPISFFSRAYLMIPIVQGIASIIIVYSICLVSHYLQTQKEKRFIRHTFQQYMAPEW